MKITPHLKKQKKALLKKTAIRYDCAFRR
uniref:Uncharacterized protein n=1 Tax=Anguilla anguilla TaxID=7936 RepID=A0A0E9QMR9_ANGAN